MGPCARAGLPVQALAGIPTLLPQVTETLKENVAWLSLGITDEPKEMGKEAGSEAGRSPTQRSTCLLVQCVEAEPKLLLQ